MTRLNSKIFKNPWVMGLAIAFLYELPYIILGQDSHIYIADNLDTAIPGFLVMIQSGHLFDLHSNIDQIMNGLPREFFANGFNLSVLWYVFFNPFTAYIVNDFCIHWFAFTGMYILLREHVLLNEKYWIANFSVSMCFALLPFYPIYGISQAGQPFLLWAFLNLYNRRNLLVSFAFIAFFPFYSMLVFAGTFIIPVSGIFFLWQWIKKNDLNLVFFCGLMLISASYFIFEYQLIQLIFFNKSLISHRVEWNPAYSSQDLLTTIKNAGLNFVAGHFHAISLHTVGLALILPVMALLAANKEWTKLKRPVLILSCIFLFSLMYAFSTWSGIIPLKEHVTFLKTFQTSRICWLNPALWYILLAICITEAMQIRYGKIMIIVCIPVQLLFIILHNSEVQYRTHGLVYKHTGATISYREFFSENLLGDIKSYIGKPVSEYRIASLGMHPAIAQYNGFYTLDSYQNNYLLSYKHQFREVIQPELEKSKKTWKPYYDYWGNRCYLFSSEIPKHERSFEITKYQNKELKDFLINTVAFKKLGGKYILSAVKILYPEKTGLKLLKIFEREDSKWRIHLYEAI
jgi:uncharacterized membrane protein